MVMADEDKLKLWLKAYTKALTPELVTDALSKGDDDVNDYLNDKLEDYTVPSPVPAQLVKAATLLSSRSVLDILGTDSDKRSPSAIQWEKEAYDSLDRYIKAYTSDNDITGRGVEIGIFPLYDPDQMEDDLLEDEEEDSV
jgi:hypothetical protein